ncbi:methyltransferase family protein [Microbacterium paludicola]|uniref:methyltransferase family protein n=1 Tax=Microbacterium paludicola TaxID=300019 RepID=UPI00387933CE
MAHLSQLGAVTAEPRGARTLGRAYFASQAVAGAAWWVAVFTVDGVRVATLGGLDPVPLALLDVPLFVVASALAALRVRATAWIVAAWTALVAAGMALYATATAEAGWGAVLMIAATAGTLAAALLSTRGRLPGEWMLIGPFTFRTARPEGRRALLGLTGLQVLVFWVLFLAVIPAAIVWFEHRWRVAIPVPPGVPVAGAVLLVAASALGLWSAHTMSTQGHGTPLPAALPRRLVVAGPYRWVRNPMAVAGIAQGVAVGLIAGSWLVVVYAICGSAVWNHLIRPHEEADLSARFGAEYDRYRASVACWVPRLPR